MVLGRSLIELRDLIDSALCEVRLDVGKQRRAQIVVAEFLDEIAVVANLHAEYRGVHLLVEPAPRELRVDADPQFLASAVLNLLTNAFKYTRAGGHVVLRAHYEQGRLIIEVEDECGGMPSSRDDPFQTFGEQRGRDRSGLGSVSRLLERRSEHTAETSTPRSSAPYFRSFYSGSRIIRCRLCRPDRRRGRSARTQKRETRCASASSACRRARSGCS